MQACRPCSDGQSAGPQQSTPFWQMLLQHLPLGQSAAGSMQLRHMKPTHRRLAQSVDVQQVPCSHRPAQHFLPWPQSASRVQARHSFCWQVRPAAQSGVAQQSPVTQAPAQHLLPGPPHWSSLVQLWHAPRMQAWLDGHSAPLQQVAPGRQRLLQHLPPEQSPSVAQALQP